MSSEDEKKCPNCGAVGTFEEAKSGADELLLCTECGFLEADSRGHLTMSTGHAMEFQDSHQVLKFDPREGIKRGITKNQYKRIQTIVESVGILGLATTVKTSALELFDRISPHLPRQQSPTMSLACLFIAVNRNDGVGRHIPLREFCQRLQCDRFALAKAKRWILLNRFEEPQDPDKTLDALIARRLRERDIPMIYERKLKRLVSLTRKGWVSAGVSDEMILWPCLFALSDNEVEGSWQPNESATRTDGTAAAVSSAAKRPFRKMSKAAFFKHYRLAGVMSKTTFMRHTHDVQTFLLSLTRHVPWLTSSARGVKEGLDKSLDWLLDNEDWIGEKIEAGNASAENRSDGRMEFAPPVRPGASAGKGATGTPIIDNSEGDLDEESRRIYVPEGEELGDDDIKDEDMHEYIRSQDEVETISKVMDGFS